jgi:lysophospholipase L1-like esterase
MLLPLLTLLVLSCISFAYPSQSQILAKQATYYDGLASLTARQNRPLLRIMPLGASITEGIGSDPRNGYRKLLRDKLRFKGFEVNMVGSQFTGDFNDKQHEGHSGKVIEEITDLMGCGLSQKPNLVLINAGTNDCLQAVDRGGGTEEGISNWLNGAYDRMKNMVDSKSEHFRYVLMTC